MKIQHSAKARCRSRFLRGLAIACALLATTALGVLCGNRECSAAGFAECTDCAIEYSCDCTPGYCICTPWAHRSSVWGEYLYLHATGVDMVHAQQQNGTGGAGTVPWGVVGGADPDFEPGYRVGGNFALNDCSSIAASYAFFESDSINTVVPPVIAGGGGAVGSLVQHPGAGLVSSAGPLTAYYNVDFQLADLAFRQLAMGDDRGWLNYSVGGRYAHLEQDFLQFGAFSGSQTGNITTQTDIEFDGGGVRFGLEGERLIGNRGFSLVANLAVSPVVGQFSSYYLEQNTSSTTQLANAVWKDDRFVTILDYEVGVAWTGPCNKWRVAAGYMGSFWYNAITTPGFVDAVQADNYTDVGDTLSFDGLTARIERRF